MKRVLRLARLVHINHILAKHGLDNLILSLHLLSPLRFLIYCNPWNWVRRKPFDRAVALREALQELGPIFVKFGQALSTRGDLLPEDIIRELTMLQDRVPPFESAVAKAIVEKEFGRPLNSLFSYFDEVPLASASIAQVHAATLHDGSDVVVKVLRPDIAKKIDRDVSLMYLIAELANRYWADAQRLHPIEVVKEFDTTIHDELDLMREAASASQLRRNFLNSELLYVPKIYWSHTREKVMVMERIHGIPITQLDTLRANHVDFKKLAQSGVEIFFTQVFRDSFFHADMHPGNLFISVKDPANPKYICVDFGIMGALDSHDLRYLAENFHAFFNRDYRRVAQLHVESGWVDPSTRIPEFEAAIRTVCEPIFERPLSEISCALMLMRLFQTGRRFNMQIQPQLLLLQKTLFAVEGLGRILYPELDLWSTAKPFLEKWLRQRLSVSNMLQRSFEQIPYWLEKMPDIPNLVYDVLQAHSHATVLENKSHQAISSRIARTQIKRRYFFSGIGFVLLLASAATFIDPNFVIGHISSPLTALSLLVVGSLSVVLGRLT